MPLFLIVILLLQLSFLPLFAQEDNSITNTLSESKTAFSLVQIDREIEDAKIISIQAPDQAVDLLKKLYSQCKKNRYNQGIAHTLMAIGSIFIINKGEPLKGRLWLEQAEPYCKQTSSSDEALMVKWNNCMGAAFSVQMRNDSALVYYFRALDILLRYDSKAYKDWVMVYTNMGATYYNMQQDDKALYYLGKAEALTKNKKIIANELARIFLNLAYFFTRIRKFDTAQIYLDKITALQIPLDENLNGTVQNLYGTIFLLQNRPEKALLHLKSNLQPEHKNQYILANCLNVSGACYTLLRNYREAEYHFRKALTLSSHNKMVASNIHLYSNLAIVNDSLGNYKKAYRYLRFASALQDSVTQAEKTNNINELEVQYRTRLKDKEIIQKELQLISAENQLNKKNLWIRGIISIACLLFLMAAFLFQRQRLRLQKAKTREEQQKVAQLKATIAAEETERSRIGHQLHDSVMIQLSVAKMGLETLPNLFPELKQAPAFTEVVQQLDRTGIQLRQTAHNLMPDALLEEGLIPALQYFCNSISKVSGISIIFQHYGQMPALADEMEITLYRMSQELIQNVLKHAHARNLVLQLNAGEEHISLTVEDDGIGIKEGNIEAGMGLKSIQSRLKGLNGIMDIHPSYPSGTSIHIEINV